jgi:hypothetical protein
MADEDDLIEDEHRDAAEVARRALTLFSVWSLTAGAPRKTVLTWLKDNALFGELTPQESGFVDSAKPSQKQVINFSWQSERLIVLLWALGHIEQLPPADTPCDPNAFQQFFPPFAGSTVEDFITEAQLRPDEELEDMAETLQDFHWHARDAAIHKRRAKVAVDIEVIQERHHAINWITGYEGLSWDEVTTDT